MQNLYMIMACHVTVNKFKFSAIVILCVVSFLGYQEKWTWKGELTFELYLLFESMERTFYDCRVVPERRTLQET